MCGIAGIVRADRAATVEQQTLKRMARHPSPRARRYGPADRLGYAVMGTPNLLEHDQGFFVEGGDGLADVTPVAGLYKSQVYAVARELGLPAAILARTPTTDTSSLSQAGGALLRASARADGPVALGSDEGVPAAELAPLVDLPVDAAYWEVERRREATRYLHATSVTF